MPSNIKVPTIDIKYNKKTNKYIEEAIEYTNTNFPNNYGSLDNFIYPINHTEAKEWLKEFLKKRFNNFGIYEDAVNNNYPFLFHSVLSPMMNIGLLTDKEVIEETLKYENKVPINSFEGFIRQIIGWRNYVYTVYLIIGDKLKKSNFLQHKNSMNKNYYKRLWTGRTNIKPIDDIIHKIVQYGYAHHIERLMYLGNYLLLCMIKPNDIYNIFMEWTIDAYEWVMVPNVYGMSQYADGGIMMTRPYFASSNYILKMSNYKKDDWCVILDSLYYNFINKHQAILKKNYSTALSVSNWNKKSEKEKKEIIHRANKYYKLMNMKEK
jgi:deoxyribodipyrimidine photolyase-related protein